MMWHDARHNFVVYDTPHSTPILERVPGSVKLHNGYVAAPVSLYNLQMLSWLGHPVPGPLNQGYEWPGPFTPFEAQRVTANFLAVHPRAFVLSDMGTGKTLAALWAADYIMRQHEPGTCRALIVAPLSTLQRVWADAIFSNLLGLRTETVCYGVPSKRIQSLKEDHDFYIINYDGLSIGAPTDRRGARSVYEHLEQREDIKIVIIDEASAYKDSTTQRHRIARQLLQPRPYLWLMTGTPTPNGPTDAYGLAKLVNGARGESFTHYKQRVMFQASQFRWMPRQGASEAARAMLQPAVRFAIEDCMDLPPCTTQKRDVELSKDQQVAYDRLKRDMVLTVKSGQHISAVNEAVLRMKLIQISCGAVYDANHDVHLIDAAPRVAALREVIEQSSGKVIVFAPLTSVLNMLSKALKDYPTAIINGEVARKNRDTIFADFQGGGKTRILIADPGTMAHGLTLTAATTIVWFAPTDKTELYLQANKRIDRPGQKFPTTIVQLAATATEREIFRRLENNEAMQGAMLQMVREDTNGR